MLEPVRCSATEARVRVKAKACELGFEKAGIARAAELGAAEVSSTPSRRYRDWLDRGYHGEMSYMAREPEKRTDPRKRFPAARSVVVLAMNYYPGGNPAELGGKPDEPGRRAISRYAAGEDYHRVIGERAGELADFIERNFPPHRARHLVDTSAILEKAWAERAGLGWQGKHTNLITREYGSWVFLAEVVTDLELEPDPEGHADLCGKCTACIDVCPTRAIVAPYVLDSRRCISYLTIEYRGIFPRELRPLVGEHVFGCDDCQEVCPWNRFARLTDEPRLLGPDGAEELDALLGMSQKDFDRRYRSSALRRAKRAGLLRNLCVALGNRRDPKAVPSLARALDDREPLVRGHAAWALGRIGTPEARQELERRARLEQDPWVREEIQLGLESSAPWNPEAVTPVGSGT